MRAAAGEHIAAQGEASPCSKKSSRRSGLIFFLKQILDRDFEYQSGVECEAYCYDCDFYKKVCPVCIWECGSE